MGISLNILTLRYIKKVGSYCKVTPGKSSTQKILKKVKNLQETAKCDSSDKKVQRLIMLLKVYVLSVESRSIEIVVIVALLER